MIRGEEEQQFLVTLPSNACDDVFPNNRPGNYKTHLPVPVELSNDWEVALVDVQYPKSWYNFVHTTRIFLDLTPTKDAGFVVAKDNSLPYVLPTVKPATLTRDEAWWYAAANTVTGATFSVPIEVRPGHYDSVKQFGEYVAHLCNEAFDKVFPARKHKIGVTYSMDPTATYGKFTFNNISAAAFYCDNVYAMNALGYTRVLRRFTGTDQEPYVYRFDVVSPTYGTVLPKRPHGLLGRDFSVYIYSDIIKPQIVGDVRAPLLGVVPIGHSAEEDESRTPKMVQYWCFNPAYYMPLRLTRFDTINILLATDEGQEVVFADPSTDKVVCRMHFRRSAAGAAPIQLSSIKG